MIKRLFDDFKEAIISVMPITVLVLIISFFIKIPKTNIISFSISSLFLTIGIAFFSFGANLSMVMIGERIGNSLIKKRKLSSILLTVLIIGFVITIAEPDLMVLASQLTTIPNYLIIGLVSLGVGIFLLIAIFRIIKGISINTILLIGYSLILFLLCFTDKSFVTVSFDAGGVTTGPMSVPFIVALGYGFTKMNSGKKSKNNTFGLVGLASIGPIIMIMILGIIFKPDSFYDVSSFYSTGSVFNELITSLYGNFVEVIISLTPILLVFIIFELFNNTMDDYDIRRVVLGLIFALLGLTIFLTGVEVGFIKMGFKLGNVFALNGYDYLLVLIGMVIGFLIVKAEPAVKVLVEQISDLTEGSISKKMINLCLSIGVCIAVGLSLMRIFLGIEITYIIVPGYILALLLMYLTPSIFTAIAFDSGGAASGPLTTTFLLPIAIGACIATGGNILTDAFGVVALVSLSPLIMIQLLGIIYHHKMRRMELYKLKDLSEKIVEYNYEVSQ